MKIRCSRFLYTLVITDKEKAEKVRQSLPPGEFGFLPILILIFCKRACFINKIMQLYAPFKLLLSKGHVHIYPHVV
jgi:hypothetical protein